MRTPRISVVVPVFNVEKYIVWGTERSVNESVG